VLAIVIITILALTLVDAKCKGNKFNKRVKKFNWCRSKGYEPKIDGCSATGEGDLKKRQAKQCRKAEKILKKCDHSCNDPVDGGWSDFGEWSECTVKCGGGTQTRSKTCTNPAPANGGKACEGDAQESKACNTEACPVDGGWSGFGEWSECTAECGGGTQTRSKTCTNPVPANGGKACEGEAQESKACNTEACAVQTGIKAAWEQIPGGLTRISKGNSGVWGVNKHDNIYRLNADGRSWTQISGALVQVASGASVWGVNRNDYIYKYLGNNKWQNIAGRLTNVDVSNKNNVWGVNRGQDIFRWTGSSWQHIAGKLIQISVGESGVWGVNAAHDIFYRQGTYGDTHTAGSGWTHIPGKLQWVGSGTNLLVGANSNHDIFYRKGITAENPIGTEWVHVPGKLMQIDVNDDQVVGTNSGHNIYRSPVGPV